MNKQGSMINDMNILKASKNLNNLQGSMVNNQQPNTQRQTGYSGGSSSILMINQKKTGKTSTTKSTARATEGGSKKRPNVIMPYQLQEYPMQNTTQFSNMNDMTHGLSNRINAVVNSNYGITSDMSTTHLEPSHIINQNHQKTGVLSYSKSTENFELMKCKIKFPSYHNQYSRCLKSIRELADAKQYAATTHAESVASAADESDQL